MKKQYLYETLESAKTKPTAIKYFRNRKIKGARILTVTKKGTWMRVQFIKKR